MSNEQGFLWVPEGELAPPLGQTSKREASPGFAVYRRASALRFSPWPGRLFEVEALDAVPLPEPQHLGETLDRLQCVRSSEIRTLRELSVPSLFGEGGQVICSVLNVASALSASEALELKQARDGADAEEIHSRAWERWRATHANESPQSRGMRAIYNVVWDRAIASNGQTVMMQDEHDWDGVNLAEPWWTALLALSDSALAYIERDRLAPNDFTSLSAGWRAIRDAEP